jgi:hypothetical protein
VWNLLSITSHRAADSISPAWIQAHGHAQIFGWIGAFILGIVFYSHSEVASLECVCAFSRVVILVGSPASASVYQLGISRSTKPDAGDLTPVQGDEHCWNARYGSHFWALVYFFTT